MAKEIKTKTIRQSVVFKASAREIYELLMDSKKHSRFSGAKAVIGTKVGSRFTAYDGDIEGKNRELIKDKKIVQSWRIGDWPNGHYSIVTYKLSKSPRGTKLEFIQTGVPESEYKSISSGWKEFYWEKMKEFLGE